MLTVRSRCPLKVTGTAQMSKFIPPEDSALYLRYTGRGPGPHRASSIIPVALAQAAPVYHNKTASLEKALEPIRRASGQGARLIAFGETGHPGYPVWLDICPGAALWNQTR